jgi:HK97 family phage portal protein
VRILDRLLARPPQNLTLESPQFPLSSNGILEALHIPFTTASSVYVDEKRSLTMPAVYRAVNIIASGVAGLPLLAYKADSPDPESVRIPQTSGQAADLLRTPHPDLTSFEVWEIVVAHMALWGNAYLHKLRDGAGVVRELWPIHPSQVTPGRASDMTKVYKVTTNQDETAFSDLQILHIPGFGYDGIAGVSPVRLARQGIGLAIAAEEFGARLFGSGALAGGVLTTDQRLTQEQADALKTRFKAKVSGLQNAHEVAVLGSGAKFQAMTIPPDDAQFLESRSFQIEEVARIFGVPPHLLMSMEKSTSWGTGIEQQTLGFVKFTLQPWLTRIEQRVSKVLQPNNVQAHFSLEGLLRGDSAQKSAFYESMWNLGALSTNEIRAREGLPPVADGDVRYRPMNFAPLGAEPEPDPADPNEPSEQEPAGAAA